FKLTPTGDKAVRQKIVIGRQNPLQYEILEGLKPGDKVIVTGYDKFGDVQELVL
ncbi:MAG TPA: efflux transporter periplasmic adaptor subunit, partial [Bacteroidales bacterium]